jgi:hypothetical protein
MKNVILTLRHTSRGGADEFRSQAHLLQAHRLTLLGRNGTFLWLHGQLKFLIVLAHSTSHAVNAMVSCGTDPETATRHRCSSTKLHGVGLSLYGQPVRSCGPRRLSYPNTTLRESLKRVRPHGMLALPAGEYPETLTINQPVHLESQGGPARIGMRR